MNVLPCKNLPWVFLSLGSPVIGAPAGRARCVWQVPYVTLCWLWRNHSLTVTNALGNPGPILAL